MKWLILIALILGQVYLYECTTVYGGPDRIEKGIPLAQLPAQARAEIEACMFQYKQYKYKNLLENCTETYNGLRAPEDLFIKAAETNFGRHKPPSGFRMRQEIRTLTDEQWAKVVNVMRELYRRGTIKQFGLTHSHSEMRTHQGAGFLIWHRIYTLHLEEKMREIDPSVSLPYWDYTIDAELDKPEDSILWTDCFFGNPEGPLRTGPFGNVVGRYGGHVTRAAAVDKFPLISKGDVEFLLNGTCHYKDFTTGINDSLIPHSHNFEPYHGNVHMWVGGGFQKAPEAPFDPIFFFHHSMIDLIYQLFRNQQMNKTRCGDIDIENDYRPENDLAGKHFHHHGIDDPLPGYSHLRNRHLLWKNWTTEFYNFAPQPSCPHNCGGKYLYCDMTVEDVPQGICMTRTKHDKVPCTPFKPFKWVDSNKKAKFNDKKAKDPGKLKAGVEKVLKYLYLKNN